MTDIVVLPQCSVEPACRWSPISRNQIRRNIQSRHPSTPTTAALNLRLNHQFKLLPLIPSPIDRLKTYQAHLRTPVTTAKSP